MFTLDEILDMVATEVAESEEERDYLESGAKEDLPVLRYDLEFVENFDGSYKWRE
ncbi:MAG: hypothetical protein U9Q06_02110 [Nanoarchaeota archaeon]|nr:hypothetical protein [Nanoarchaeota archaeon]